MRKNDKDRTLILALPLAFDAGDLELTISSVIRLSVGAPVALDVWSGRLSGRWGLHLRGHADSIRKIAAAYRTVDDVLFVRGEPAPGALGLTPVEYSPRRLRGNLAAPTPIVEAALATTKKSKSCLRRGTPAERRRAQG